MHRPIVFIGPGSGGKKCGYSGFYLGLAPAVGLLGQPVGKFSRAHFQVFGQVIQNLGPQMTCAAPPTIGCGPGCLSCIAQIFAVAQTHLAHRLAARIGHRVGIPAVGPHLLAPNKQLGGTVQSR